MKKALFLTVLLLGYITCFAQDTDTQQVELKKMILEQTLEGGKYDFFTPIKGKEYEGSQIKPNVYATKQEVALIKWGRVNYDLGIKKLEDVYSIFSEYKGREINEMEKAYIKIGYNREI